MDLGRPTTGGAGLIARLRQSWQTPMAAPALPYMGLILLLLVLRGPGFIWHVINIDETDFLLGAQSLLKNGEAYVSFVEKKPPFIYGFYAFLTGIAGSDLRGIRAVTLFWVLTGCLVIRRAALLGGLGDRAAWFAAFAFGAFSSNISVATDCETLMNLPVAISAYFAVLAARADVTDHRHSNLWAFLAGAASGVAFGFKQQAGMAWLALIGFHWTRVSGARWSAVLWTTVGFASVIVLTSAWFLATGRWDAFIEWNLLRNMAYMGDASPFDWIRMGQALSLYGLANGVVFLAIGAWGAVRWWRRERNQSPLSSDSNVALLALWLYWTAWVGVAAGGRFYTHYFLQLVPGAALLAAWFWARSEQDRRMGRLRPLVVGLLCAAVVGFGANTWARGLVKRNFPSQDPTALEMAQWLKTNTGPSDRVFVWGYFNPIYVLADRRPATRFVNPSLIVGDFDPLHVPPDFDARPFVREGDVQVLVQDLEAARCEVFIDSAPADLHGWSRFPLSVVPTLARHVRETYVFETMVAGAPVYRRPTGASKPEEGE